MTVAQYFHDVLTMNARAIEILHIADRDGLLAESERHTLATWMLESNRFAEAIPILELLLKKHPDSIDYSSGLMTAYFHSQRPEQLQELIDQMQAHFHDGGRWTENTVKRFADACRAVEEHERARDYLREAIVLHQRSDPSSGLNDQTLSDYYQQLADTESHLGNTRDAVEATVSAIVCRGSGYAERAAAIETLATVVEDAKDLDGLVAQIDAEADMSGQDNPILRRVIGTAYHNRDENPRAIIQLNADFRRRLIDDTFIGVMKTRIPACDSPTMGF